MPPDQQSRRFSPMPVEMTARSNKKEAEEQGGSPKAPRKFAVQPIEESTKSSKEAPKSPPARRFAPQPIEQTTQSSRTSNTSKPKSRFAPQPFETSSASSSNRKQNVSSAGAESSSNSTDPKPKRTFAPQLIDTSSRSRKSNDHDVPLPSTYKTDVTPGHTMSDSGQPVFSSDKPKVNVRPFLLPHERRRERSDSHSSRHRHSFISPDLDTIESSESEPSNPPSLSTSPSSSVAESPLTTSDTAMSEMYKHATRVRESVDESFSRYMLQIEAKRAELRLREQALAAFPNSDFHEPVEHYVDEEDDSDQMDLDDRPATWEGHDDDDDEESLPLKTFRRDTTKYNWELQEMKQHHESLEQEKASLKTTAQREATTPSPWWNEPGGENLGKSSDAEYSQMMDRARPPMLGSDIKFPRSKSPDAARFDVTQGSATLRQQMCYLTEEAEASSTNPKTVDGLWGTNSPNKSRSGSGKEGGLWGGFCVDDAQHTPGSEAPTGPTGLMTPSVLEPPNPFESLMPSPKSKRLEVPGVAKIDAMLNTEREIDELMKTEFDDTFITQVFNYLSLGYPSLARPFDEELSKIAKVPISELRHDDDIAKSMPKGYIRLGDDFEGRGNGQDQDIDMDAPPARWSALKKYIREWVRQEKGMVSIDTFGGYGTAPRRGSWAW